MEQGEYLGNFVICKENATMNNDFSWTVYQNDKVRALLNRSVAQGQRLFAKVDQISVHDAFVPTVKNVELMEAVETEIWDFSLEIRCWTEDGKGKVIDGDYDRQYALLGYSDDRDRCEFSKESLPYIEKTVRIVVNGLSTDNLIAQLNREYGDILTFWTERGRLYFEISEKIDLDVFDSAPRAYIGIRWTENSGWDRIFDSNRLWQYTYAEWMENGKIELEPSYRPLKQFTIPELNRVVHAIELVKTNIDDGVVFWNHSDLGFNNLNITPITSVAHNNVLTKYDHFEGTVHEVVQLSSHPKLQFYTYKHNDEGAMRMTPVCVPDFHIVLSFWRRTIDFKPMKRPMLYLGNFVISLENTRIDRQANIIEVYQNDKVRHLLDRIHQKGKKLYAKVDQINFETAVRGSYNVIIKEFDTSEPGYKNKTGYNTLDNKYREVFNLNTDQRGSKLWQSLNDAVNNSSDNAKKNQYNVSYSDATGLTIVVTGRSASNQTVMRGCSSQAWTIQFSDDLCEDYHLPKAILSFGILADGKMQNVTNMEIRSENKEGSTNVWVDTVTFQKEAGRDCSFHTNQMYFYHPDLSGENCNLEPLTIACQYPGINHFNQNQYYHVRSLSAPTRIRFFYWSAKETGIVDGVRSYDYVKEDYIPANFNVVISYYEGD